MYKSIFKFVMVLVVSASLSLCFSQGVNACAYTPNCAGVINKVVCGSRQGSSTTHKISYANGYVGTCVVTTEAANHSIRCNVCDRQARTEWRTCNISHSIDTTSSLRGICQK